MSFLLPFATSLFSSPLVQNALGSLASGAIGTIKGAATSFLNNGVQALTGEVNNRVGQLSGIVNDQVEKINNYNPEWVKPSYSRRNNYNKRMANYEDDEFEEEPVPRKKRNKGRNNNKRTRSSGRVVYNPDLITEYEE